VALGTPCRWRRVTRRIADFFSGGSMRERLLGVWTNDADVALDDAISLGD
jgi:hypothetical protein